MNYLHNMGNHLFFLYNFCFMLILPSSQLSQLVQMHLYLLLFHLFDFISPLIIYTQSKTCSELVV